MYKTTFLSTEWALPISFSSKGLVYRISIGQWFSGTANKESSLDVGKHQPINPFGSFLRFHYISSTLQIFYRSSDLLAAAAFLIKYLHQGN